MNEMLFKPVEQRQGPSTAQETTFAFLERGGRKEAVEIRQWIESWFQAVPGKQRKVLERRLKSERFGQFLSAMFELQVHEILRRCGCMMEWEPELPGSGTVEFRVSHKHQEFYVEATVCGIGRGALHSNENEQDAVEKLRKNLKRLHSDLRLSAKGELKKSLGKKFVRQFQDLLDTHTPEEVRNIHRERGSLWAPSLPSTEFHEGDWVLTGLLRPTFASNGVGKVLGPARTEYVDGATAITTALKQKVKNWIKGGMTDRDFLIAINVCHSDAFSDDPEQAIFGRTGSPERDENFLEFLSCVNGVLVFYQATLGNERSAPVRLYQNGKKNIPACLQFLLQEQRLGDLLGIGTQ